MPPNVPMGAPNVAAGPVPGMRELGPLPGLQISQIEGLPRNYHFPTPQPKSPASPSTTGIASPYDADPSLMRLAAQTQHPEAQIATEEEAPTPSKPPTFINPKISGKIERVPAEEKIDPKDKKQWEGVVAKWRASLMEDVDEGIAAPKGQKDEMNLIPGPGGILMPVSERRLRADQQRLDKFKEALVEKKEWLETGFWEKMTGSSFAKSYRELMSKVAADIPESDAIMSPHGAFKTKDLFRVGAVLGVVVPQMADIIASPIGLAALAFRPVKAFEAAVSAGFAADMAVEGIKQAQEVYHNPTIENVVGLGETAVFLGMSLFGFTHGLKEIREAKALEAEGLPSATVPRDLPGHPRERVITAPFFQQEFEREVKKQFHEEKRQASPNAAEMRASREKQRQMEATLDAEKAIRAQMPVEQYVAVRMAEWEKNIQKDPSRPQPGTPEYDELKAFVAGEYAKLHQRLREEVAGENRPTTAVPPGGEKPPVEAKPSTEEKPPAGEKVPAPPGAGEPTPAEPGAQAKPRGKGPGKGPAKPPHEQTVEEFSKDALGRWEKKNVERQKTDKPGYDAARAKEGERLKARHQTAVIEALRRGDRIPKEVLEDHWPTPKRETPPPPVVTPEKAQRLVNARTTPEVLDNGSYLFRGKGGGLILVNPEGTILFDPKALQRGYGGKLLDPEATDYPGQTRLMTQPEAEAFTGKEGTRGVLMTLDRRQGGDLQTLAHEFWHGFLEMGATDKQRAQAEKLWQGKWEGEGEDKIWRSGEEIAADEYANMLLGRLQKRDDASSQMLFDAQQWFRRMYYGLLKPGSKEALFEQAASGQWIDREPSPARARVEVPPGTETPPVAAVAAPEAPEAKPEPAAPAAAAAPPEPPGTAPEAKPPVVAAAKRPKQKAKPAVAEKAPPPPGVEPKEAVPVSATPPGAEAKEPEPAPAPKAEPKAAPETAPLPGERPPEADFQARPKEKPEGEEEKPFELTPLRPTAPTFFSALDRAVDTIAKDKKASGPASGEQWTKRLLNTQGVKPIELETRGILDALERDPSKKYTAADIQQLLKKNEVKLREVVRGDEEYDPRLIENDQDRNFYRQHEDDWESLPPQDKERFEELREQAKLEPTEYDDESYNVPGGTNYREFTLERPEVEAQGQPQPTWVEYAKQNGLSEQEAYDVRSAGTSDLWKEWKEKETKRRGALEAAADFNFSPAHWGGRTNIIGHTRVSDRTTLGGHKILFVDEFQGDQSNAGRRRGWYNPYKPWQVVDRETDKVHGEFRTEEEAQALQQKIEATSGQNLRVARGRELGKVPNTPLAKDYAELMLKRMLRFAAEHNYDGIGWTWGDTQAERWRERKLVDQIHYNAYTGELEALDAEGDYIRSWSDVKPEMLENHLPSYWAQEVKSEVGENERFTASNYEISKNADGLFEVQHPDGHIVSKYDGSPRGFSSEERAQEYIDYRVAEENKSGGTVVIKPDGFFIGGEGKRSLYDVQQVAAANKIGRKFGAKVDTGYIEAPGMDEMNQHHDSDVLDESDTLSIHEFPINDAMRDKTVYEGQPLFQARKKSLRPDEGAMTATIEATTLENKQGREASDVLDKIRKAGVPWAKEAEDAHQQIQRDAMARAARPSGKQPSPLSKLFSAVAGRKVEATEVDTNGAGTWDHVASPNMRVQMRGWAAGAPGRGQQLTPQQIRASLAVIGKAWKQAAMAASSFTDVKPGEHQTYSLGFPDYKEIPIDLIQNLDRALGYPVNASVSTGQLVVDVNVGGMPPLTDIAKVQQAIAETFPSTVKVRYRESGYDSQFLMADEYDKEIQNGLPQSDRRGGQSRRNARHQMGDLADAQKDFERIAATRDRAYAEWTEHNRARLEAQEQGGEPVAARSAAPAAPGVAEEPALRAPPPGAEQLAGASFQARAKEEWYSPLEEVVERVMKGPMTPDQFESTLSRAPGVKKDEWIWRNVDRFVADKKKTGEKITKTEFQEYLRRNTVQVEDVVKSPSTGFASLRTKYDKYVLPGGRNYKELLLTLAPKRVPVEWQNKPNSKLHLIKGVGDLYVLDRESFGATLYDDVRRSSTPYPDVATAKRDAEKIVAQRAAKRGYVGPHWSEPDVLAHIRFNDRTGSDGKKMLFIEEIQSDQLMAGRNEGFYDPRNPWEVYEQKTEKQVKRFATEEEAKKYAASLNEKEPPLSPLAQVLPGVRAARQFLVGESKKIHEDPVPLRPFVEKYDELAIKRMIQQAAEGEYDELAWTTGDVQNKRYGLDKEVNSIKFSPAGEGKTALWIEDKNGNYLAADEAVINQLPNALASDEIDYGGRAGLVVNEKDLRRLVGNELAEKILKGEGVEADLYEIYDPSTGKVKGGGTGLPKTQAEAKLADYEDALGQKLALRKQLKAGEAIKSIEGEALRVGGEGKRRLYDEQFVNFANNLGKKFGAQVGKTQFDTVGEQMWVDHTPLPGSDVYTVMLDNGRGDGPEEVGSYRTQEEADLYIERYKQDNPSELETVHSIPITPQMRESALEHGQPLFQARRRRGQMPPGAEEPGQPPASEQEPGARRQLPPGIVAGAGEQQERYQLSVPEELMAGGGVQPSEQTGQPEISGAETMAAGAGLQPVYDETNSQSTNYVAKRFREVRDLIAMVKEAEGAREKAKEADAGAIERGEQDLRVFTAGRDLRRTVANQTAQRIQHLLPTETLRNALNLMRDFRGREDEIQQYLDGSHPAYQQGIDYDLYKLAEQTAKDNKDKPMLAQLAAIDPANPRYTAGDRASLYAYTHTDAARWEALKKQRIETFQKLREAAGLALKPTADMHRANAIMTQYYRDTLNEGRQAGLFQTGRDPRQYVNRYYNSDETLAADAEGGKLPPAYGAGQGPTRAFEHGKQRVYDTIGEAIANGQKPATYDAADLMRIYGNDYSRRAATLELMEYLKNTKDAQWAFLGSNKAPLGWRPLRFGGHDIVNTVPFIDEKGELRNAHQAFFVPPKIAEALRPITDRTGLEMPWYRKFRAAQRIAKQLNLSFALFHEGALTVSAIANMGPKAALAALTQHVDSPEWRTAEQEFIRAGGTTTITGDSVQAYRRLKLGATPTWRDVVNALPVIKEGEEAAAKITKLTFDISQRKWKVYDFQVKDAQWILDHPKATQLEHIQAQRGLAKEINAIYGGLHWENLGVNQHSLDLARAFLLAPDWTFSNFLTYDYTGKNLYNKLRGRVSIEDAVAAKAARGYWTRSVLYGVAATQGMSLMLGGKLSTNPTQVYLGKDAQGKEIYQNMFFRGASADLVNIIHDVQDYGEIDGMAVFMLSKAAPGVREALSSISNRNWLGQQLRNKDMDHVAKLLRSINQLVPGLVTPFSVQNLYQIMLGDEYKDTRAKEALAVLLGTRTRHVAPPSKTYPITLKPLAGKVIGQEKANQQFSGRELGGPPMKWNEQLQQLVPDTSEIRKEDKTNRPEEQLSIMDQVKYGRKFKTKADRLREEREAEKRRQAEELKRRAQPPGVLAH